MYFWPAALTLCGYGRWHWLLALCCGWANAADAVEILCTSFLLPSAEVGRQYIIYIIIKYTNKKYFDTLNNLGNMIWPI